MLSVYRDAATILSIYPLLCRRAFSDPNLIPTLFQHYLALGQGVQKPLAIKFGTYSRVKDGDYTSVVLGADQPPKSLL